MSAAEYERLVAEVSVDGRVLCLLLWESPESVVEVKFETTQLPPLGLDDLSIFLGATAAYLKDGLAERPEAVLSQAIASRASP